MDRITVGDPNMKWVAIDMGTAEIKASVEDEKFNPVPLGYPMGGYKSTRLLSEVVISTSGETIVGDDALFLGIQNPEWLISDWQKAPRKEEIACALLKKVYHAATTHYGENIPLGVVILYGRTEDKEVLNIAEKIFEEVKSMSYTEVLRHAIPAIKQNLSIIADFGAQYFKVSILDGGEEKLFVTNPGLGFSAVDMDALFHYPELDSFSLVENSLYGILLQRIKIALNNAQPVVLPKEIHPKGGNLQQEYNKCMEVYLYQCFEECSNALQSLTETWNNVGNIVFIGGGANSSVVDIVFGRYMQSKGCALKSYNSMNKQFNAQYALTQSAIQMPLRQKKSVTVRY